MSATRMWLISSVFDSIYRAWAYVTHGRTFAMVLGIGFAILAITLLIASRTRWGQAKPMTKCVVLSILAHVWLLMYAYGTHIILPQGDPRGHDQGLAISMDSSLEPFDESANETTDANDSNDIVPPPAWEEPVPLEELARPEVPQPNLSEMLQLVSAPPLLDEIKPTPLPALPEEFVEPEDHVTLPVVSEQLAASKLPVLTAEQAVAQSQSAASSTATVMPPTMPTATEELPEEYQLRQAHNRLQLAMPYGADADSEASVEAGLLWLVKAQSPDGAWNAKRFGGGTETQALGEHRHGTGDRADTGVSGLALLAFLSAGHTHLDGDHRKTVEHGLSFLMQSQMPSGDLSGPKQIGQEPSVMNARMYCHGIATLALAEAYAMTHDEQLKPALVKAAQFTINAQDVRGGGWRYRAGDAGDLSQFGWQAMSLRSIERSGIAVPIEVKRRMQRFLDSCAAGKLGGLARYQPGQGPVTETMTAEALACRLIIGYPLSAQAQREAKAMIMLQLPGMKQDNVYYWYYATLAMFQLQDADWTRWNQALKQRLLTTQLPAYDEQAGSWNPDPLWGGYGGRVYATAMSCLCLEVYYRYLPMYQHSNVARSSTLMQR
jgi:hypothetical protein